MPRDIPYHDPDIRCGDCEWCQADKVGTGGGCEAASDAVDPARLDGWPIPTPFLRIDQNALACRCPGLKPSQDYHARTEEARGYVETLRRAAEGPQEVA